MPVNKRKVAARKGANSLKAKEEKPVKAKEQEVAVPAEDAEESEDSEASEESADEESGSEEVEAKDESADESEKEEQDESSESESSERGEKRKAEDELEEAKPKKTLKIDVTAPHGSSGFTIFIGSIDFTATEAEISEVFGKCGKIAAIRLSKAAVDPTRNKGTCYIDFEDKAGHDAALKLNGTELKGRPMRVDHAEPLKKEPLSTPSNILFVANLPFQSTEEEIEGTFSQYGEVVSCTLLTFGPDRKSKGLAYVEYTDKESAAKAIKELENAHVSSRPLRIDYAGPRGSNKIQKREPKFSKGKDFKKDGNFNKKNSNFKNAKGAKKAW
ncbi:hypothetical protein BJV82DRAFT_602494 [Fennellomyces sp. T-0311]|nr:hypothetical protein BJV82DRAFT_602494 [Fennellomyces sp. T-0311]